MTRSETMQEHAEPQPTTTRRPTRRAALALSAVAGVAVLAANLHGLAIGDDGVGYWATADSLNAGRGLRYFLEDPLTVWPPGWPTLMALLDRATPLTAYGAALVLNSLVAVGLVLAVHALLRRLVDDPRLVLAGTAVAALGPSMIGLGHLLMTDQAFALVIAVWMGALIRWHDTRARRSLALAVALAWAAVMVRYVGVVLMPIGAAWLLLERGGSLRARLGATAAYVAGAAVVPFVWMLRNQAADGTMFGPRWSSARGPIGNAFDIVATLGRFVLPGVADALARPWALVGLAVGAAAVVTAVAVSRTRGLHPLDVLGSPAGLPVLTGGLYLAYMLYQRSTVALNQLDLRLLNPAYLPLMISMLVLIDRAVALGGGWVRLRTLTVAWAGVNVAVGLGAIAMFASDADFLKLNYERQAFDDLRAGEAITSLPDGCRLYSNLPNALYAAGLEARWSPRRTALESNDGIDDLTPLLPSLGRAPTCLVWFELEDPPERPTYGNLLWLDELGDVARLEPLARTELPSGEAVATYRVLPRD